TISAWISSAATPDLLELAGELPDVIQARRDSGPGCRRSRGEPVEDGADLGAVVRHADVRHASEHLPDGPRRDGGVGGPGADRDEQCVVPAVEPVAGAVPADR